MDYIIHLGVRHEISLNLAAERMAKVKEAQAQGSKHKLICPLKRCEYADFLVPEELFLHMNAHFYKHTLKEIADLQRVLGLPENRCPVPDCSASEDAGGHAYGTAQLLVKHYACQHAATVDVINSLGADEFRREHKPEFWNTCKRSLPGDKGRVFKCVECPPDRTHYFCNEPALLMHLCKIHRTVQQLNPVGVSETECGPCDMTFPDAAEAGLHRGIIHKTALNPPTPQPPPTTVIIRPPAPAPATTVVIRPPPATPTRPPSVLIAAATPPASTASPIRPPTPKKQRVRFRCPSSQCEFATTSASTTDEIVRIGVKMKAHMLSMHYPMEFDADRRKTAPRCPECPMEFAQLKDYGIHVLEKHHNYTSRLLDALNPGFSLKKCLERLGDGGGGDVLETITIQDDDEENDVGDVQEEEPPEIIEESTQGAQEEPAERPPSPSPRPPSVEPVTAANPSPEVVDLAEDDAEEEETVQQDQQPPHEKEQQQDLEARRRRGGPSESSNESEKLFADFKSHCEAANVEFKHSSPDVLKEFLISAKERIVSRSVLDKFYFLVQYVHSTGMGNRNRTSVVKDPVVVATGERLLKENENENEVEEVVLDDPSPQAETAREAEEEVDDPTPMEVGGEGESDGIASSSKEEDEEASGSSRRENPVASTSSYKSGSGGTRIGNFTLSNGAGSFPDGRGVVKKILELKGDPGDDSPAERPEVTCHYCRTVLHQKEGEKLISFVHLLDMHCLDKNHLFNRHVTLHAAAGAARRPPGPVQSELCVVCAETIPVAADLDGHFGSDAHRDNVSFIEAYVAHCDRRRVCPVTCGPADLTFYLEYFVALPGSGSDAAERKGRLYHAIFAISRIHDPLPGSSAIVAHPEISGRLTKLDREKPFEYVCFACPAGADNVDEIRRHVGGAEHVAAAIGMQGYLSCEPCGAYFDCWLHLELHQYRLSHLRRTEGKVVAKVVGGRKSDAEVSENTSPSECSVCGVETDSELHLVSGVHKVKRNYYLVN